MIIKKFSPKFKEEIQELLFFAFGNNRFPKTYANLYIDNILQAPYIFPSFVALNEENRVAGYIIWRIKSLVDEALTLEIQELAAIGADKLNIEKKLAEETPIMIGNSIKAEFSDIKQLNIEMWIHHKDKQNSVLYDSNYKFLGTREKKEARGEIISLYEKIIKIE